MKVLLKKAVHTHYSGQQLCKEKLAILKKSQADFLGYRKKDRYLNPKIWKSLVAAAAIILFLPMGLNLIQQESLQDKIVAEVVYNHSKRMSPEVKTASISSVQDYLSRLEFQLIQSSNVPESEWKILGGRYCTIQGRLACLIQVQNKTSGMVCSFYQVPIPKGFSSEKDMIENYLDGLKVKVWSEKGLLLALVGPDSASV